MCTMHMLCVLRVRKRVSDPLELTLQMIVIQVWVLETKPSPLQEQTVLIAAKPCHQILLCMYVFIYVVVAHISHHTCEIRWQVAGVNFLLPLRVSLESSLSR